MKKKTAWEIILKTNFHEEEKEEEEDEEDEEDEEEIIILSLNVCLKYSLSQQS